jgi:hypothetical protein
MVRECHCCSPRPGLERPRRGAGAAAARLDSVLASTMRRVEFAVTTVPFRHDLTAFKVHFLIRTYHVFLTVMTDETARALRSRFDFRSRSNRIKLRRSNLKTVVLKSSLSHLRGLAIQIKIIRVSGTDGALIADFRFALAKSLALSTYS